MRYEIIQPPFTLEFAEMSRPELEDYGKWFHEVSPDRIAELAGAVASTPGYEDWIPDRSVRSLSSLGRWFATQVQTRHRSDEEMQEIRQRSEVPIEVEGHELTNFTFSLAMDIGMYFGQVVAANLPGTQWAQPLKNKRFADYGQPVLMGFGTTPLNPVQLVVTFAYGLVRGSQTGDRLRDLFDYWSEQRRKFDRE